MELLAFFDQLWLARLPILKGMGVTVSISLLAICAGSVFSSPESVRALSFATRLNDGSKAAVMGGSDSSDAAYVKMAGDGPASQNDQRLRLTGWPPVSVPSKRESAVL